MLVFAVATSYAAVNAVIANNVAVEKLDDKPKKETKKSDSATANKESKDAACTEKKAEEKKACSDAKPACNKEQKSSCGK